jgi:RHS repeat-associated protein
MSEGSLDSNRTKLTRIYSDRLGSTRATDTIEPFGGGWTTRNYYPFGEEITSTSNDQFKFASTYRDSATGLDYALNRYYASGTARFLTPDPYQASGGPASPQSWNRYAYVFNDPVNHLDPTGLFYSTAQLLNSFGYGTGGAGDGGGGWGGGGGGSDGMEVDGPMPELPADGGGGGGRDWLGEWNNLSAQCRQGLETALPVSSGTNASVGAQLRLDALGRAGGQTGTLAAAAGAHNVDWTILAGIALRESGFNNVVQANGNGVGIFQIDLGKNPGVTVGQAMDMSWAANWAAATLSANASALSNTFPGMTGAALQHAVAASYNRGLGGVTRDLRGGLSPDAHTTNHNYGSNVLDLASCFKEPH